MRRGNLSGELHRALGFLLLLVLVLSPPMRQEGARAGARARVRLDRGRRPFCTVCLSRAPAADRASDAQASVVASEAPKGERRNRYERNSRPADVAELARIRDAQGCGESGFLRIGRLRTSLSSVESWPCSPSEEPLGDMERVEPCLAFPDTVKLRLAGVRLGNWGCIYLCLFKRDQPEVLCGNGEYDVAVLQDHRPFVQMIRSTCDRAVCLSNRCQRDLHFLLNPGQI